MREILFRGKAVGFEDSEWVYGDLIATDPYRIIDMSKGIDSYVFKETVGQWTGRLLNNNLTNKEEKLFDGDIVGWSEDYDDKFGYPATAYGQGVIVWNEANCCFGVKTSETNIQDFNDFDFDDSCVIIGNIHDNPVKGDAE